MDIINNENFVPLMPILRTPEEGEEMPCASIIIIRCRILLSIIFETGTGDLYKNNNDEYKPV